MVKPKSTKRIYLINRDFQLRYIRAAVLVGLCSTMLTMFVILYPLFYLKVLRFPNFLPAPFLIACVVAALLNFFMIAFLGVRLSHRIAGPVFAMVRYLRTLQSGQYNERMRVRDSDELKYLARHLGDLGDILHAKTTTDLVHLNEIITIVGKSQEGLSKEDRIQVLTTCEKLKTEFASRIANTEPEKVETK
jgi:hypothetical protein